MELIATILAYSQSVNYLVLFLVYLIEGPVANLFSAFLAGLGFLNIWYVFVLAATAEASADVIYFALGRIFKNGRVSKFLDDVEKNSKVFKELKKFMNESPFLLILFTKMFGPISIPGLLYIGQENMPWKTFLKYGVPLSIARNAVISIIGYSVITSLESFLSAYSTYRTVGVLLSVLSFVVILLLLTREDLEIQILRFTRNRKSKV